MGRVICTTFQFPSETYERQWNITICPTEKSDLKGNKVFDFPEQSDRTVRYFLIACFCDGVTIRLPKDLSSSIRSPENPLS